MKPDEALTVLEQVCAAFQGNLAQHQQIQAALAVIRETVSPVSAPSNGAVPVVSQES